MSKAVRKRHKFMPAVRGQKRRTYCGRTSTDFAGYAHKAADEFCKMCIKLEGRYLQPNRQLRAREQLKKEPSEERLALFKEHLTLRQKGLCAACGRVLGSRNLSPQLDHIVPRSRGGPHIFENLQVLCRDCNLSKMAKNPVEWAIEMGYDEAATRYAKALREPDRQQALF